MDHEVFMRRALQLALQAEGHTSPNPMVGAVVVRDGRIIGEGYHHRAGGPHAEVEALRATQGSPAGATMYVSLEPCCVHGRTPPCTSALIEAGIAEVHYAVPDDNPRVSGGGHRLLEAAGVRVFRGPLEAEGRFLNRAFFQYITSGRAHVTAKYAMSLDGKLATATGDSQWITGAAARTAAHGLRQVCDAVIVGAGTLRADNPRLTTRLEGVAPSHPLRVILAGKTALPLDRVVFQRDLPGRTLVVAPEPLDAETATRLQDQGVEVVVLPGAGPGHVDVAALLRLLAERGVVRAMVEGGAGVLGSFHDAGLIDEAWVFLGAKMIGGTAAPGPIGGQGVASLAAAGGFRIYETQTYGGDVLLKAVREAATD